MQPSTPSARSRVSRASASDSVSAAAAGSQYSVASATSGASGMAGHGAAFLAARRPAPSAPAVRRSLPHGRMTRAPSELSALVDGLGGLAPGSVPAVDHPSPHGCGDPRARPPPPGQALRGPPSAVSPRAGDRPRPSAGSHFPGGRRARHGPKSPTASDASTDHSHRASDALSRSSLQASPDPVALPRGAAVRARQMPGPQSHAWLGGSAVAARARQTDGGPAPTTPGARSLGAAPRHWAAAGRPSAAVGADRLESEGDGRAAAAAPKEAEEEEEEDIPLMGAATASGSGSGAAFRSSAGATSPLQSAPASPDGSTGANPAGSVRGSEQRPPSVGAVLRAGPRSPPRDVGAPQPVARSPHTGSLSPPPRRAPLRAGASLQPVSGLGAAVAPSARVPLRDSGQVLAAKMREERVRLARDQHTVATAARRMSSHARAAQEGAGWFEVRARRRGGGGQGGAPSMSARADSDDDAVSVTSGGSAVSWLSQAWRAVTARDAHRNVTLRPFMVGDVVVPPPPPGVSDAAMLAAAGGLHAQRTHGPAADAGLASESRRLQTRAEDMEDNEQTDHPSSTTADPVERPPRGQHVARRARKRRKLDALGTAVASKTPWRAEPRHSQHVSAEPRLEPGSGQLSGAEKSHPVHERESGSAPVNAGKPLRVRRRGDGKQTRSLSPKLRTQPSGALSTSALAAQVTPEAAEGAGLMSTAGRILEIREDILTNLLLNNDDLAERLATSDPAVLRRRLISEHALLEDAYLADIMPAEQRASLWDMDDEEAERYVNMLQKSQASGARLPAEDDSPRGMTGLAAATASAVGSLFTSAMAATQRRVRGTTNSGTFLMNSLEETRRVRGRLNVVDEKTISETMKERGVVDASVTDHEATNVARVIRSSNAMVPDEAASSGCCRLCFKPHMSEKRRLALSKYHQRCAHLKHTVVEHRYFQAFVIFVILLAAAKEGAILYDLSPAMQTFWRTVDTFAIAVFVLECIIKILVEGLKPWRYFTDSWNLFDFVIVVMALVPGDVGAQFAVFRLLRVLRVLKLIRAVPKLRVIVNGFLKALSSIGYVSALLALEFYLFSALAVTLLGSNDPKNFGNLHLSLLSLWAAATGDDWTDYMYTAAWGCDMTQYGGGNYGDDPQDCTDSSPVGVGLSASFFLLHYVLGSMVLLNLFIGVLMLGMQEAGEEVLDGDSLEVHLMNAEGVAEADFGQKSDPYAVLSIPSLRTQRSRTVTRTLNPLWDKRFVFNNIEEATSTTLDITVYDWDRLTADDKLGFVSINFAPLQYGVTYVYELRLQADKSTVVKRFTDDGEDDTSAKDLFGGSEYKVKRKSKAQRAADAAAEDDPEGIADDAKDADDNTGSRVGTFFSSIWKRGNPVKRVHVAIPPEDEVSDIPTASSGPLPAAARLTRTPRRFTPSRRGQGSGPRRVMRVRRPSVAASKGTGPKRSRPQSGASTQHVASRSRLLGKRIFSDRKGRPNESWSAPVINVAAQPSMRARLATASPQSRHHGSDHRPRSLASPTSTLQGRLRTRRGRSPVNASGGDSEDEAMSLADVVGDDGFIRMPDQGKIFFKVTKRMSPAHSRKMRMADAATVHGWDKLICLTYRAMGRFHEVEKIVEQRRARKSSLAWESLQRQHARAAKASALIKSSLSRRIAAMGQRNTGYGRREDVDTGTALPRRGAAEHPSPGQRKQRDSLLHHAVDTEEGKVDGSAPLAAAIEQRRRSKSDTGQYMDTAAVDTTTDEEAGPMNRHSASDSGSDSTDDGTPTPGTLRRQGSRIMTRGNKRLLRLHSRRSPGSLLQTILTDGAREREKREEEEVVTPKQLDMLAHRLGLPREALLRQIGLREGEARPSTPEAVGEEA